MHVSGTESSKLLSNDMLTIRGKGNHSGHATGKTFLYAPDFNVSSHLPCEPQNEEVLYFDARRILLQKLRRLYGELRAESECAWIFLMQITLLCDNIFTELPHLYLHEGKSAEETAFMCRDYFYSVLLKKEGGDNLQVICADIDDITLQLVGEITKKQLTPPPPQAILLCKTPLPSYMVEWRERLAGIASESKTSQSHHSELALSLGIPYVKINGEIPQNISGKSAFVDADRGYLYINPDLETLSHFAQTELINHFEIHTKQAPQKENKKTLVFAELGNPRELNRLSERICDGIGKFTSEEFYLEQMCLPDEEMLFEEYRRAAETMPTKPIIIRGLKTLGSVHLESVISEDTAGDRGELYVLYDTTLRTQLRAVMRAAVYGSLQFLLPQNDRYSDIFQCAQLMEEISTELYEEDREFTPVPLGSVIDTVSSALMCEKIIEECDFVVVDTEKLSCAIYEKDAKKEPRDSDCMCFDAMDHIVASIAKATAKKKKRAVLSLGKNNLHENLYSSCISDFWAVSISLENISKVKKKIFTDNS